MKEKTAKALHALLKELYKSPAAKEFVDEYEHERRHQRQDVPVNWSGERDHAYHDLTEAIFKREPLLTIQKAAETFVDICNREERRKPEISDVYQDIFGNRYVVVTEEFLDGEQSRVGLMRVGTKGGAIFSEFLTPTLEEFMNPTFKKV